MTNQPIRRFGLLIAVLAVLCLAPVAAYGQDEDEEDPSGKADVPAGKLQISNGSESIQAHFSLRNGAGDWVQFSLDPRKSQLYGNATSLRIVTKDGPTKQYKLEDTGRYIIGWGTDEKCWVLKRLVQGH